MINCLNIIRLSFCIDICVEWILSYNVNVVIHRLSLSSSTNRIEEICLRSERKIIVITVCDE